MGLEVSGDAIMGLEAVCHYLPDVVTNCYRVSSHSIRFGLIHLQALGTSRKMAPDLVLPNCCSRP